MRHSISRAVMRSVMFVTWTGLLLGPYLALQVLAPGKQHHVARWFFKGCLVLTGLRLRVHGRPARDVALYAANHAAYLDIPVMGAVIRNGLFIAKAEVSKWPLFGFLARISRTEFVSRSAGDALAQRTALTKHLNVGANLILFPEGTSTNGSFVRPFKSTLFSALERASSDRSVQPVTIAYTRKRDGSPLTQKQREQFTWFGDMTLAPHLWGVFGLKGCDVDVVFHAPVSVCAFAGRKPLAKFCEETVRRALESALGDSHGPASQTHKIDEPILAQTFG